MRGAEKKKHRAELQTENGCGTFSAISTILVPRGAEYRAVCRGLRQVVTAPVVVALPVGLQPAARFLERWQCARQQSGEQQLAVLLMGLCGSLAPQVEVGDVVLYQGCMGLNAESGKPDDDALVMCDRTLIERMSQALEGKVKQVKGLSCDRILCSACEKQQLGQQSGAEVVDMEGTAVLNSCNQIDSPVAMLRVVSDDCYQDLPDLTAALSSAGQLKLFPLVLAMIRQPLAARQLIRGSLRGLARLQAATTTLFTSL